MEENLQKPSPVTMILYLIDNDNTTPSQNWEIIPKKKYTIGRSKKEVDLPLNLKLLSRKHAELTYYDSKTIMIKDLDSRNGTFINKLKIEPLKETFFTDKDIVSFGNNTNNKIMFFENNKSLFIGYESKEHQFDIGIYNIINKENKFDIGITKVYNNVHTKSISSIITNNLEEKEEIKEDEFINNSAKLGFVSGSHDKSLKYWE